jgi:hypothetical protein
MRLVAWDDVQRLRPLPPFRDGKIAYIGADGIRTGAMTWVGEVRKEVSFKTGAEARAHSHETFAGCETARRAALVLYKVFSGRELEESLAIGMSDVITKMDAPPEDERCVMTVLAAVRKALIDRAGHDPRRSDCRGAETPANKLTRNCSRRSRSSPTVAEGCTRARLGTSCEGSCNRRMRVPLQVLLLLMVVVAGCTAGDGSVPAGRSASPSVARLAGSPPLLGPDGQVRFVTTAANEVRAEDAATGAIRWTLPTPVLAAGSSLHWRLLVAGDGSFVYIQSVLDGESPTYLGTRRVDARTGVELASDIKFEIYWYENVVLWTALTDGGALQMAIERARAAGGGYRLRTFDPLTLKMLTDVQQAAPPAPPAIPRA